MTYFKNRNLTVSIMLSKHYLISLTNMLQNKKKTLKNYFQRLNLIPFYIDFNTQLLPTVRTFRQKHIDRAAISIYADLSGSSLG